MEHFSWYMIPTYSPNFGGGYERMVGSVKTILYRLMHTNLVSFDLFRTMLAMATACVNSRPLAQVSNDPRDPLPVTPAHLVIGRGLHEFPDWEAPLPPPGSKDKQYRERRRLIRLFWYKWHREFFLNQQEMEKWQRVQNPLQLGQLVLIKNMQLSQRYWPLGVITKVFPSKKDGKIRVVEFRTVNKHGKTVHETRDIRNIYTLEDHRPNFREPQDDDISDEEDDSGDQTTASQNEV